MTGHLPQRRHAATPALLRVCAVVALTQVVTWHRMFSREVRLREAMKRIIMAIWTQHTAHVTGHTANDVVIGLEAGERESEGDDSEGGGIHAFRNTPGGKLDHCLYKGTALCLPVQGPPTGNAAITRSRLP